MAQQSGDSPLKNSSVTLTNTGRPTVLKDVVAAVQHDLDRAVGVIPAPEFMAKFLNIDENILNTILPRILNEFYDTGGKRWKAFPVKGELEDNFYKPFVNVANAVNKQIRNYYPSTAAVQGIWIDCHSKAPQGNDTFIARIRPDCAFVSNQRVLEVADQQATGEKRRKGAAVDEVCFTFIVIYYYLLTRSYTESQSVVATDYYPS